jgi:hypothetical protein
MSGGPKTGGAETKKALRSEDKMRRFASLSQPDSIWRIFQDAALSAQRSIAIGP